MSKGWRALLAAGAAVVTAGCTTGGQWEAWSARPSHFASTDHMWFSARQQRPSILRITERDLAKARDQSWWGDEVPSAPPIDMSGTWRGRWRGIGILDIPREADVELTLQQEGALGVGHLLMWDVIAAEVPAIVRMQGLRGVRVYYEVSGAALVMKHVSGDRDLVITMKLVDDRLVGRFVAAPAALVLTRVR